MLKLVSLTDRVLVVCSLDPIGKSDAPVAVQAVEPICSHGRPHDLGCLHRDWIT